MSRRWVNDCNHITERAGLSSHRIATHSDRNTVVSVINKRQNRYHIHLRSLSLVLLSI